MAEILLSSATNYWTYYRNSLSSAWNNLQPMEYGVLLIAIAFVGWLLMKTSLKRQ